MASEPSAAAAGGMDLDLVVSRAQALAAGATVAELHTFLVSSKELLWAADERLLATVDLLDPSDHCVAVIHLLAAKAVGLSDDAQRAEFLKRARQALLSCQRAHVSACAPQVFAVAQAVVDVSIALGDCLRSVKPLRAAVAASAPSATTLTGCHALFLQVCIKARAYKQAADLLSTPIMSVAPATAGGPRPFALSTLQFFYYGGMVFCALKRFDEAIDFFKMCIAVPARVASQVCIEAAKKHALACLIRHGKVLPFASFTSPIVIRAIARGIKPYQAFVDVYTNPTTTRAAAEASCVRAVFEADSNWGLAKQALCALTRQKIKRLTRTYITLSLSQVATEAGLPSEAAAQEHLLAMIQEDEICARIDPSNGMVSFGGAGNAFDSAKTAERLHEAIARTMELSDRVRAVDRAFGVSKPYIKQVVSSEAHHGDSGPMGSGSGSGSASGFSAAGAVAEL